MPREQNSSAVAVLKASRLIDIRPYDPNWEEQFRRIAAPVAEGLADLALAIEHVGSTSVRGLSAKPIIDLDVLVAPDAIPEAIRRLSLLGYSHKGDLGIEGREAFGSPPVGPPHHLYLCPVGSPEFERHILFRDFMRGHPETAQAYAKLKVVAADQAGSDHAAYSRAKSDFVGRVLLLARAERTTGPSSAV